MTETGVLRTPPVRYATAERFARPRPVAPDDTRPSSGEVCPQPPSRLEAVMGRPKDSRPQGEDCLNLSVTAPERDGALRPVLVWFHGGGFSSGAGLLDWYEGSRLSAQGDVVVVSVNYRLGALGYLCLDGVCEGNLGLYDQIEALRWVRRNITAYGGDPDNVTLFGQSAGGLSISWLLELPEARGLFRRAALQSAPLPYAGKTRMVASVIGDLFAEKLGGDPRTASVDEMLRAQQETAVANRELTGSAIDPSFGPVESAEPILSGAAHGPGDLDGLDVLYGWNADDMTAFPGDGDPAELTEHTYPEPLTEYAGRLREAGARTFGYRLDWSPEGSPLGATHCLELPLLLGSREAWEGAPMLGGASWEDVEEFGAALRTAWTGFARTGTPDTEATAAWPVTWGD